MATLGLACGLSGQFLDPVARAVEAGLDEAGAPAEGRLWLLTAADGRRWASHDGAADAAVAPGSLLKPFAAVAWLEAYGREPPVFDCDGAGCWLPSGHGRLGLTQALAHSCNRYFSLLVASVERDQVAGVALRYGLTPPPAGPPDALWGWGADWLAPSGALLQAYAELARRRQPATALVLEGLAESARSGTAAGVGAALPAPALAKTGTAPCRHARRSSGDGLAVALYPATNPRYTMLLQTCGRTGRETAVAVGRALAKLTEPRGSAHR